MADTKLDEATFVHLYIANLVPLHVVRESQWLYLGSGRLNGWYSSCSPRMGSARLLYVPMHELRSTILNQLIVITLVDEVRERRPFIALF